MDDDEVMVLPGPHAEGADKDEEMEEDPYNEEYYTWKKNTRFLYDLLVTHKLDWPSLTVQWLPNCRTTTDDEHLVHELLLGTHTNGDDPNYLKVGQVQLPLKELEVPKMDEETQELGGYRNVGAKVDANYIQVKHEGEVNRARYMPSDTYFVATKTPSSEVHVYNLSKRGKLRPQSVNDAGPDYRLLGHTQEGYGLCWDPHQPHHLISGSNDAVICEWDIANAGKTVEPLHKYSGHSDVIEDVAWHVFHTKLVGSVGDDKKLLIWDMRTESYDKPAIAVDAHTAEVNCFGFSPFNEFLVATGSADKCVNLWDMRKMNSKLHSLEGHTSEVDLLQWSPHNETILASSADCRLNVWDLSKIGEEQPPTDAEDGPPELIFIHGGHTARISDFSWSPSSAWMMVSVAEDNLLHIWQMADHIYNDEEQQEVADEDVE